MKLTTTRNVSRRQLLRVLAAAGITGPAAIQIAAQVRTGRELTPEIIATANAIVDQQFPEDRRRIIATALQRNFDQFQLVRDLEIDDLVEPAPIFSARGR